VAAVAAVAAAVNALLVKMNVCKQTFLPISFPELFHRKKEK